MPRRRITFAFLAAIVLSMLAAAFAGSAAAGGPTSVLLVVPGAGPTASLYTGSADYEQLMRLLTADQNGPDQSADPSGLWGPTGVTITWLIHDVQVWRVDQVDLSADGGPLITTRESTDDGSIWDAPVRRHRSADGTALAALLHRLGLTGISETAAAQPMTKVESGSATTRTAAPRTAGIPGAAERWSWGVAGLLLGSALTLGSILLSRRSSGHPRAEPAMATEAAEVLDTRPRARSSGTA